MNILIKQATIVDPNSPHNGKKQDILIEKGRITSIRKQIPSKGKVIEGVVIEIDPVNNLILETKYGSITLPAATSTIITPCPTTT